MRAEKMGDHTLYESNYRELYTTVDYYRPDDCIPVAYEISQPTNKDKHIKQQIAKNATQIYVFCKEWSCITNARIKLVISVYFDVASLAYLCKILQDGTTIIESRVVPFEDIPLLIEQIKYDYKISKTCLHLLYTCAPNKIIDEWIQTTR